MLKILEMVSEKLLLNFNFTIKEHTQMKSSTKEGEAPTFISLGMKF